MLLKGKSYNKDKRAQRTSVLGPNTCGNSKLLDIFDLSQLKKKKNFQRNIPDEKDQFI
jgi:hypothetical protein